MTKPRALGSALLVLLGVATGVGIDRTLLRAPSKPDSNATATDLPRRAASAAPAVSLDGSETSAGTESAVAQAISMGEAEESIRRIMRAPPSCDRSNAIREISSRISSSEVPSALRLFDRLLRNQPEWDDVLSALASRWAAEDPAAAVSGVKELKGALLEPVLLGLVGELVKTDPGAARELLTVAPPSSFRHRIAWHLFRSWAEHDLSSTVAWVSELPDGWMKEQAMEGILEPWSRVDPAAAASYFESLPRRYESCLERLAGTWASRDPSGAWTWGSALPPGPSKRAVLRRVLAVMAQSDPRAASALVPGLESTLLPEDRAAVLGEIARVWAETDIEAAARWFQELPPGIVSDEGVNALCTGLAEVAPAFAAEFIAGLPPGAERAVGMGALARVWAHRDIDGALAWTKGLKGEERSCALRTIFPLWAESDVQAALSYARTMEPKDVVSDVLSALASADPESAAAFIDELPPELRWEMTTLSIVNAWTEVDPRAAAAWVETIPEGELRNDALQSVAISLASYDRSVLEGWISGLPAGASRDSAITAFVHCTASRDPGAAAGWAARIDDPSLRIARLEQVGRHWLGIDPVAARQWILNSALPDDMKTQLLDSSN
jgi:hypothetical protein